MSGQGAEMMWWDGPLVGFDLESTSTDPEQARAVSAALVVCGAGREAEKHAWLINPGVEIPQGAIDVHGITNERVRAHGLAPGFVWEQVIAGVRAAAERGWPVIAHNARYDFTVADRELRRLGMPELCSWLAEVRCVDPIVIDRHLDRYRPKALASHSLEDCCRVWGVPLEGVTHDATFDAIAACRLAWRLATSGRVIRRARDDGERQEFLELVREWDAARVDLDVLYAWQQRIAAADAERLEAYFRAGNERKGVPAQPDRVCARDWPIVPITELSSVS